MNTPSEETEMTILTDARAEALFTSPLATGSRPDHHVVEQAIRTAVRVRGGVRGCAGDVAAEYGDHPECAVPRMRWARGVVEHLYETRRPSAAATVSLCRRSGTRRAGSSVSPGRCAGRYPASAVAAWYV